VKVLLLMKYIKSIIPWLTQSSDTSQDDIRFGLDSENSSVGRFLYPALLIIFIGLTVWFYRGSNARLLGPPFGEMNGQDFRQILRASQEIVDGESIYQHAIPYAESPDFGEFKSWTASPYPYSPIVAVFAIPFLQFDENSVLIFWTVLSWIFLLGTGWVIVRCILGDKNIFKILLVLVVFSMYGPVHLNLNLVQLDILILFLLALSFFLYKRQSIFAGVVLGFAMALKVLVAPLVAYFLWKKDWKTSFTAVIVFGTLTVIGFSIVGWDQLPDFLKVNYLWSVTDMLSYPFNQSLNGLGIRLFTSNPYIQPLIDLPVLATIMRVLGILVVIFLWLRIVSSKDNRSSIDGFLEYGFTLSTMLFLSPLVDDIHYVWVLLPIGCLLGALSLNLYKGKKIILPVFTLFCVLYLANPDLHDAIYYGWENLVYNNTLVSMKYGLLTGAYLYGLIGLEISLFLTLLLFRQRDNKSYVPDSATATSRDAS